MTGERDSSASISRGKSAEAVNETFGAWTLHPYNKTLFTQTLLV